jgi:hypothetical protein
MRMRRRLVAAVLAGIAAAASAQASDWFGADGAVVEPLGTASDFATGGTSFELRWRHYNNGRSALEITGGYFEMGLGGEIEATIARYAQLVRVKNELAQLQGGPGDGYLEAEYGVFTSQYLAANLLFHPFGVGRLSPFVSFGGGAYRWRAPFRLKFFRTPFFGEQRAYDEPAEGGTYVGVVREEQIEFTKNETSGGVNGGLGLSFRITDRLMLDGVVRTHLLFSSGRGNREEGIDDQNYLDDITFMVARGGLNFRF